MTTKQLRLGSRGSELALWQAEYVKRTLEHLDSVNVTIEIIRTTGDKNLNQSLSVIGGKGAFTKEIENALLNHEIDIAVHSLKDLPTDESDGLTIGAIPERGLIHDVIITREAGMDLGSLPQSGTVATGSIRRRAQLLHHRPDLQIVDIRGNVPTRLRKFRESNWDGLILAAAGIERLAIRDIHCHAIDPEWILPAPGQGALAVQCRSGDDSTLNLLEQLNHEDTRRSVQCERSLLRELGGGCQVPIGARAMLVAGRIELEACICDINGRGIVRARQSMETSRSEALGKAVANELLNNGGREFLATPEFNAASYTAQPDV